MLLPSGGKEWARFVWELQAGQSSHSIFHLSANKNKKSLKQTHSKDVTFAEVTGG